MVTARWIRIGWKRPLPTAMVYPSIMPKTALRLMSALLQKMERKSRLALTSGKTMTGNSLTLWQQAERRHRLPQAIWARHPIASGKYKVVLDGPVMANFLGVFGGVFFAENIQKGFSMLGGKVGTQIAADCVTLRDDPLLPEGYASTPFDSEGVPCYNKAVVEHGVLKTYLYNRKAAKKRWRSLHRQRLQGRADGTHQNGGDQFLSGTRTAQPGGTFGGHGRRHPHYGYYGAARRRQHRFR